MRSSLSIEVEELNKEKKYQLIKFAGEFDKPGQSEIKDELELIIKNFTGSSMVFDFNKLKFINSEGIGYLMEIHTHLVQKDQQLVIVALNSHVKDVFETIGIAEIITIRENLKDFLNKK